MWKNMLRVCEPQIWVYVSSVMTLYASVAMVATDVFRKNWIMNAKEIS